MTSSCHPRRPLRPTQGHRLRQRWLPLLLALGLFVLGCDDSSTDPNSAPILLSGVVTYQGASEHDYQVPKGGTVRIQVDDLRALLVDVTFNPNFVPVVAIAIGRPAEEGCATSARFSVRENELLLFELTEGSYCLQVSDPGSFPVDASIAYEVSVRVPS